MSDFRNLLIDISDSLLFADNELHLAEVAAREIDVASEGAWDELSALLERIVDLRVSLAAAVTPAMRSSMDSACREIDELADLADAASY